MVKKTTTITVEESVINRAKKEIPNISGFVETILIKYLNYGENSNIVLENKRKMLIDEIKEYNSELAIINEKIANTNKNELNIVEYKNNAWKSIWGEYRKNKTINLDNLSEKAKILEIDNKKLLNILDTLYFEFTGDITETESWVFVLENYGK